jgi:hypothetical protein
VKHARRRRNQRRRRVRRAAERRCARGRLGRAGRGGHGCRRRRRRRYYRRSRRRQLRRGRTDRRRAWRGAPHADGAVLDHAIPWIGVAKPAVVGAGSRRRGRGSRHHEGDRHAVPNHALRRVGIAQRAISRIRQRRFRRDGHSGRGGERSHACGRSQHACVDRRARVGVPRPSIVRMHRRSTPSIVRMHRGEITRLCIGPCKFFRPHWPAHA